MASSRRHNISCATCGKTAGIFTCRGCSENFCLPHTNEHREYLEKQMDGITVIHDQLKQSISGQATEQFNQSLMQQIGRWEQESIRKIQQVANDTREQLSTIVRSRTENIKEKVAQLTQQLNRARHDGEFFESDLKEWTEKLRRFQQLLLKQQKIRIYHEKNSVPFISKISLHDLSTDSSLVPSAGDTSFDMNYKDIHQDYYEDYSEVKEKIEYSYGEHSIRFKIDQFEANSSLLFGITSKSVADDINPFENSTLYGWTGENGVYRAGKLHQNYRGYENDIQTGDIFMLTINCDRETIMLTNERTRQRYELEVDVTKCPLPWQTCIRFFLTQEN